MPNLSRRGFVGAAAAGLTLALAACSGSVSGEKDAQSQGQSSTASDAPAGSPKVLVAYFSATGHTEAVAKAAADELGADVFAITPVEPYTSADLDYNDSASRVCREHDDPSRKVEVSLAPEGLGDHDVILLGYPIWWGGASWVLDGFVTGCDLSGKTVVPFCTSASSPLGTSDKDLAAVAGAGDWLEGRRFSSDEDESNVRQWARGLGL